MSETDEYDLESGPDPATVATDHPEPREAANPVHAVGIGPGSTAYLTPRGKRSITEADVIVGFETVVEFIRDHIGDETTVFTCGYRDEATALENFADRVATGASGTAVLMGDPNHSGYQFVGKVQRVVDRPVRIIPGISALQIAASRARTPMEATTFVTLHKSGEIDDALTRIRRDVGTRNLLILPRPFDWMPESIAAMLCKAGANPELETLVFERLTHENESRTQSTLGALAADTAVAEPTREDTDFSDLSVLAIRQNTT